MQSREVLSYFSYLPFSKHFAQLMRLMFAFQESQMLLYAECCSHSRAFKLQRKIYISGDPVNPLSLELTICQKTSILMQLILMLLIVCPEPLIGNEKNLRVN